MAAYDLEEQDKLEDLKAFWARWGNIISTAVTLVCLAIVAYSGWKWYNKSQAEKAAVLYQAVSDVAQAPEPAKELAKAKDAVTMLVDKYPSTAYTSRGALMLAKLLFDQNDLPGAKAQLQWVANNAKEDEIRQIARLRSAAVSVDEKKYDEALATLEGKFDSAMEGLVLDAKGDVFTAAGRVADARTAYTTALEKLDSKSQLRNVVTTKLDALPSGDAKPAAAATTPAPTPAPAEPKKP